MKTIIYYFSGTGNSLAAARRIAEGLGDCELVPIASLQKTPGDIVPGSERVGIVCPVYFVGLPLMVAGFAERLDLSRVNYTFSVVTLGGSGGSSTLRQLEAVIRKRPGGHLDAGFMVRMPGNYILMYDSPTGAKREQILLAADKSLDEIIVAVREGRKTGLAYSPFAQIAHAVGYRHFRSHAREADRKFTVSDACTSCGICRDACPAGNIDLIDGKPVWKHHCEQCCACIHLCPPGAIQSGKKTAGRVRYRNPGVSIADLKGQRDTAKK